MDGEMVVFFVLLSRQALLRREIIGNSRFGAFNS